MFPKRRANYSSARYGGKIGGRRFRMPRRVKKLAKKFMGVNFNFERTALVTDDKCVYLQHSTMPLLNILKFTCYCIMKALLNRAGIQFSSFQNERAARIGTGDTISVTWKPCMGGGR